MLIKNKKGYICNVGRYESPEEYADYLEGMDKRWRFEEYHHKSPGSFERAIKGLRYGDITLAAEAEKIMDKLAHEGILSSGLPLPSRSVTGSLAIMPLYEAGIPNCMVNRNMSDVRGVNTPLNIYWDRFRSGVLHGQAVINRGIALTAFVMAMNNIRPVNLYFISCSCPGIAQGANQGLFGGLIRMETRPLDLARATWIFTNNEWSSRLTWMAMRHRYFEATGQSPNSAQGPLWLRHDCDSQEYADEHRDILEMGPDDIFAHGMHVNDKLSHTNPVAWVKLMIEKHTQKQQEGE